MLEAALQLATAFTPDVHNILGLLATFTVSALATSAGVGGGAFFVPLFNLVVGFGLKDSTALSQAVIAAGGFAGVIFNLLHPHPSKSDKPLVDLDLAATLTPALLFGVNIGVLLNRLFPTWLITSVLTLLLLYLGWGTVQKGLTQWKKETAAKANQSNQPPQNAAQDARENSWASRLERVPGRKLVGIVGIWVVFASTELFKSRSVTCSTTYWLLFALQLVLSLLLTAGVIVHAFPKGKRRVATASAAEQGNGGADTAPLITPSNGEAAADRDGFTRSGIVQVAVMTAGMGLIAGLVGLGGGMMFGPLLLSLGVHPQVVTATSNVLVFMSSSSATLAFAVAGRLVVNYALVYSLVAMVASTTGLLLLRRIVTRSGRPSIVVLILAFIMLAGAMLTGIFGGVAAWEAIEKDLPASHFSGLCSRK